MPLKLPARQRAFKSSTGSKIRLSRDRLGLELEADHLWSLKTRLDIPLARIALAFFDPVVGHDRPWSPAPGASLPGSIVLGNASKYGDIVYWDVHDSDHAIVIELRDEWRTWLVVSVDDPAALVSALNEAVGGEGRIPHSHPDPELTRGPDARRTLTPV